MTSIADAMADMSVLDAKAYKQGVEAGVGLMLDVFVAQWADHPEVVEWALDMSSRWAEKTL